MSCVIWPISIICWLCVLPSRAFIASPNSFWSSTWSTLKTKPDKSTFTNSAQDESRRLERENGSSKRALLALYGLQNRDHGCAWASHLHVREELESMGYTVDMFVYEIGPDSNNVDGVPWSSGSLQDKLHDSRVLPLGEYVRSRCANPAKMWAQVAPMRPPDQYSPWYVI